MKSMMATHILLSIMNDVRTAVKGFVFLLVRRASTMKITVKFMWSGLAVLNAALASPFALNKLFLGLIPAGDSGLSIDKAKNNIF